MQITTKHTKHTKYREVFRTSSRALFACFVCFVVNLPYAAAQGADRPNILWLSTEDMSPHLGCYGDEQARTPNIDALASKGVLYENAFVPAPVCAVCRSAIIAGVYAPSLGTHHMRSRAKLPEEIRCFTEYLRDAGYYCTNNAKEDYNFRTPKTAWDESSGRAHWRNRARADQPFFAVFNFTGTHESAVRGDEPKYSRTIAGLAEEELHDPASLALPPYYPDTPKVREHWARYYNTISALDQWIGERLAELDEAGLADETIVVFWSDHGAGLPRAKRWLYDSGLRVPLVVRIPEKYRDLRPGAAGSRSDRLVSLIDLGPTMLNLCGLSIPQYMQGQAFLGDDLPAEREFVFASRDRMDESYDCSRAVRTKRYKYIRNYMPWRPWAQHGAYPENNDIMRELRRLHAAGELTPQQARFLQGAKPAEEFYDLQHDPHELHNLAADGNRPAEMEPLIRDCRNAMRAMLDLGIVSESHLQQRRLAPYGMFREQPGSTAAADGEAKDRRAAYRDILMTADIATRTPFDDPRLLARGGVYWEYEDRGLANYWHVVTVGWHSTPQTRAADVAALETLLEDPVRSTQIAAAEMLARLGQADRAADALLGIFENADSPWDQIAAANAIDLLPNFDELGERIVRISDQIASNAQDDGGGGKPGGYLARWSERFRQRLQKP
ncbi:MAG TPA: sulfatase-like hydrolase/transferase [Lacipirellula sp.]